METADQFHIDARKAVIRMGRWVLMALYKHPPRVVEGYFIVKLEELRTMLATADEQHRRWLRSRISSWTWTLRWIESLKGPKSKWTKIRRLALEADEQIRKTSDVKVSDRARQETFVGWKRVMAERKMSGRKRPRRKGAAAS